jgi:hypothetical protein
MRTNLGLFIVTLWVAFLNLPARGEPTLLPHEQMGLRSSGRLRWVVYLNNTNFNFKRRPVADFDRYNDASECCNNLNKALPDSSPYFYEVSERQNPAPPNDNSSGTDLNAGPAAPPPSPPDYYRVRPKTIPRITVPGRDDGNSVAGKKGRGTIDGSNVVIAFAEDGSFTVTGELEGSGQWSQTGKAVTMQTRLATFQGVLDGNTLTGIRVRRSADGSILTDKWSITFSTDKRSGPATDSVTLDGTWKKAALSLDMIIEGNRLRFVNEYGLHYEGTWQWSETGKVMRFRADRPDNGSPFMRQGGQQYVEGTCEVSGTSLIVTATDRQRGGGDPDYDGTTRRIRTSR